MKLLLSFLLICSAISIEAQTIDTTNTRVIKPVKKFGQPVHKVEKIEYRNDIKIDIFGEYTIDRFEVLGQKSPNKKELQTLIGTLVKVQGNSITGTAIDPMTFSIYEVERLQRDDFVFRVFGNSVSSDSLNLPLSFNVHKTDNENCYGIVEIDAKHIAIPYKGVLLFLTKN